MFFVEDFCVLNDKQKEFLNSVVDPKGINFPFYLGPSTDNRKSFAHGLIKRDEIPPYNNQGEIISEYYFTFYDIFNNFCRSHGINVRKVLRAAVNYSIYYDGLVCEPHVDHNFDHCNFLMYLTNCNGGNTVIYDEDGKVIKLIPPEKFKVVVFNGLKHAIERFEPGEDRIVLVFTFIKE